MPTSRSFAARASLPLAALLGAISLAGLTFPSLYARESASWTAQALGQDWVDLLLAVPWLVIAGLGARRGSRRALLLLGGGLAYTVYELVIYAFAVRFNALFLVYCATLGLALFSLCALGAGLLREDPKSWYGPHVPARAAGGFLITVAVVFALLWLAEVVPALARGSVPPSVAEAGVATNPVHVLDLAFVLPAHVLIGVWLLRGRSLAYALAPILLGFDALMAASIAGMMVVMGLRGLAVSPAVAAALAAVAAASAILLARVLRRLGTRGTMTLRPA
jgi:hypothetical protein